MTRSLLASILAALVMMLVPCPASGDAPAWTHVAPNGPSPRSWPAMAYDTARGRVVLFGGYNNSGYLGDTWEWDGSTWTQRATTGPSPRYWHAMAYDAARGRVVLFGGVAGSFLGDTWEWDGSTWTQRATTGPSPRYAHAMAYDTARERVVLFGGSDSSYPYFGDTWEWDGTSWTQRATTGPLPRFGPAMAYDTACGRVLLFGGNHGGKEVVPYSGDTWEWDGASWTYRGATGPSRRSFPAMAYDAARGRVVLFGGDSGAGPLGDTWEWDGNSWSQRSATGPSPRYLHAMAYDTARGRVVLFGGYDGTYALGDTWELPSSTLYIEPGAASPPQQAPPSILPNLLPNKDYLVLITHGWQCPQGPCPQPAVFCPAPETTAQTMAPIKTAIEARISANPALHYERWQVLVYDWTDSATECWPWKALQNGRERGKKLGEAIAARNYKYVHLIAHSAGAGLIDAAAKALQPVPPLAGPRVLCTFLDAYTGWAEVGSYATWAEQYYAIDPAPLTQTNQQHCYDVNVTLLDPNASCPFPSSYHRFPVEFYQNTVAPVCDPRWGGTGFRLSLEGGNFLRDPNGEPILDPNGDPQWKNTSELPRRSVGNFSWLYPERALSLNEQGCITTSSVAEATPVDLSSLNTFSNPFCGTVLDPLGLTLATCPPPAPRASGSSTPETSWVNIPVALLEGSEFLQMDVDFTSGPAAEGLLSLYLDGTLLLSVDERFAPDGVHTITAGVPAGTLGGTHPLGFRLDSFSVEPSSVTVSNVRQGKVVLVPICPADADGDGAIAFSDITAVLATWGATYPGTSGPGDANRDGMVSFADITAIFANWGTTCP